MNRLLLIAGMLWLTVLTGAAAQNQPTDNRPLDNRPADNRPADNRPGDPPDFPVSHIKITSTNSWVDILDGDKELAHVQIPQGDAVTGTAEGISYVISSTG